MDAENFHENNNSSQEKEHEASTSLEGSSQQESTEPNTSAAPVAAAPITTPVVTPASAPTSTPAIAPSQNSAGTIILQWLAYAFWGWLIVALLWTISIILTSGILNEPVEDALPYAIAATVVLLPVAFITDVFYIKREPTKKTGAAVAVMSIHAVIYALLGIGALIVAVLTGLYMLINSTILASGSTIAILTSIAAALLYAGIFVRIINPAKTNKLARRYGYIMLAIALGLIVVTFVGPFAKSLLTKNDRLIEQNLGMVQSSVNSYIKQNDKLPSSLSDVAFNNPSAEELVTSGKVTYKPGTASDKSSKVTDYYSTSTFTYQLCVTYKAAKGSQSEQDKVNKQNKDYTYLSATAHGAGNTCYDLNYQNTQYQY